MTRSKHNNHESGLGRGCQGSRHHSAKLDEDDVRLIRAAHREGLSIRDLATKFEVEYSTMWKVVTYYNWRHVP